MKIVFNKIFGTTFLFCCLLLNEVAPAQNYKEISTDSLDQMISNSPDSQKVNILTELALRHYKNDPEKAKKYCYSGKELSESIQASDKEARFLNILGVILSYQGNYDSSFYYYSLEIKIGEKINDKKIITKGLMNMGLNYSYKSDFDSALYYYLKSLPIQEELQDSMSIGNNLSNIGNLYYRMDSRDKAIKYLNEGMKIFELLDNQSGIANDLNSLAAIYDDAGEKEKAIQYYNRSLKIKEDLDDKFGMVNTLTNLAGIQSSIGHHDLAMENYKKALHIENGLDDKAGKAVAMIGLADELDEMNKHNEAIIYADSAYRISGEIGNKLLQRDAAKNLGAYYSHIGNFQKAYETQKIYKTLSDSILNETKTKQVSEMETKYNTVKKEKENALLTANIESKEKQLLKDRNQFYFLIGLLVFIITVSLLIYSRNKLKQKKMLSDEMLEHEKLRLKAVILTQESERKRIALELHDGLGQMLSAARLNVAALENTKESGNNRFNTALALIDDSCRELRNISHDMMPALLVKSGLIMAVEELAEKINASSSIRVYVNHDGNINRLPQEAEINIFRIIQELLNNIIRYANATEVHIQFQADNNNLTMMLEDNGKGFDKKLLQTSKGNGWHNIQSRLELIHGNIEIDSQPGKGTVVHMDVSLEEIPKPEMYEKA